MESQPQNPEFRNNHDYFHPWSMYIVILKKIFHISYIVGAQKNRLIETVLLSTHNICLNCWLRKYS